MCLTLSVSYVALFLGWRNFYLVQSKVGHHALAQSRFCVICTRSGPCACGSYNHRDSGLNFVGSYQIRCAGVALLKARNLQQNWLERLLRPFLQPRPCRISKCRHTRFQFFQVRGVRNFLLLHFFH